MHYIQIAKRECCDMPKKSNEDAIKEIDGKVNQLKKSNAPLNPTILIPLFEEMSQYAGLFGRIYKAFIKDLITYLRKIKTCIDEKTSEDNKKTIKIIFKLCTDYYKAKDNKDEKSKKRPGVHLAKSTANVLAPASLMSDQCIWVPIKDKQEAINFLNRP